VLINCLISKNCTHTSFNIFAHPNAGLPNAFERRNTEQMQVFIKEYLDDNLINILVDAVGQHQSTLS
jgi:5-methyltetrahydrofolate--homocysteine methyltransferase